MTASVALADWRTSPPSEDYTVDELMIAYLASTLENGDQACNGMASFLPVSAFMLARLTHAPGHHVARRRGRARSTSGQGPGVNAGVAALG